MEHIPKNCKECRYYGEDIDGTICRHPFYAEQKSAYAGQYVPSLWKDTLPTLCPYYKAPEPCARVELKDVPPGADILWATKEVLMTNTMLSFTDEEFRIAETREDRYIGFQNGIACFLKH